MQKLQKEIWTLGEKRSNCAIWQPVPGVMHAVHVLNESRWASVLRAGCRCSLLSRQRAILQSLFAERIQQTHLQQSTDNAQRLPSFLRQLPRSLSQPAPAPARLPVAGSSSPGSRISATQPVATSTPPPLSDRRNTDSNTKLPLEKQQLRARALL